MATVLPWLLPSPGPSGMIRSLRCPRSMRFPCCIGRGGVPDASPTSSMAIERMGPRGTATACATDGLKITWRPRGYRTAAGWAKCAGWWNARSVGSAKRAACGYAMTDWRQCIEDSIIYNWRGSAVKCFNVIFEIGSKSQHRRLAHSHLWKYSSRYGRTCACRGEAGRAPTYSRK
jgi:hypothetical protein